jgi:hypothetical protein
VKNLLYRLTALVLGFSVAFGLAEITVRVLRPQEVGPTRFAFDPTLGYIPVPRQKARRKLPGVYDFTYSNNFQGLRGNREYGPKRPGACRVLLLGDSFTYGFGVNDDQTFAHLLEQYLRQHNLPAEVINAGNPGKGTDYELKVFQTIGVQFHPDLTVLCFFPGSFLRNALGEYYAIGPDGEPQAKRLKPATEGIKAFLFQFPGYNWLISWSHAANLVKETAVHYLVLSQTSRESQPNQNGSAPVSAAPVASSRAVSYSYTGLVFSNDANRKLTDIYVAHLMAAVKQAGSDLAFCYVPVSNEVEAYRRTKEISPDEAAFRAIIEARGGTLFSLTPVLAARSESIRDLYYTEGHWTRRAHELVGNALGNYFHELLKEKLQRQNAGVNQGKIGFNSANQ